MTIDEYIYQDLPFYHLTPSNNIESILKEGLKGRNHLIFVVRSEETKVWNAIIAQMNTEGDESFAVIKLIPSKHHISAENIISDNINENTANLQNCIITDSITVDSEDIFVRDYHPDYSIFVDNEDMFDSLEGYHLPARFNYSNEVDFL